MDNLDAELARFELPIDASGFAFFLPNYSPALSIALFPQSGSVALIYEPGSPAPSNVYIAHQGGPQTSVPPGESNYAVNAGDYLIIVGQAASCKIQWSYQ